MSSRAFLLFQLFVCGSVHCLSLPAVDRSACPAFSHVCQPYCMCVPVCLPSCLSICMHTYFFFLSFFLLSFFFFFFQKSNLTLPLCLRILPLFEDSKIDFDTPQCQIPILGVNLNLWSVYLWQNIKRCHKPWSVWTSLFWNNIQASKLYPDIYRRLKSGWEGCCYSSVICCSK